MISVIMPVWIINDELYELTRKALFSISNAEGFEDAEIIIVDNASKVGADQLLQNADKYIRNKENLGYPGAVNQGIMHAQGDLIAVANNDIRVSPNWIEVTEKVFDRLDNIGSLHFKMVEYDAPFNVGKDVWNKGKERWCTGSFFVFNRQAIDALKGKYGFVMDENYGLGGYDDWDWHHRLNHELDWYSAYTNAAAYQHKDSTSQNLRDKKERSKSDKKNREYFKEKYGKYPEEIWKEKYPKQFKIPWRPFP